MKKIMIMAVAILMLGACKKEGSKISLPITNDLQSDPDMSLAPLPCGVGGGALFYGTMTIHGKDAKVYGQSVNKTCSPTPDGKLAVTSDDIVYFPNGDQLWTKGNIVITFDGSSTATITGGSTIAGGTGRFKCATGYFIYENMTVDLKTGHESHTSHGEISF